MTSKRTKRQRVKEEIDYLLDCVSNATSFSIEIESSNIDLSPDLNNDSIPYSDLYIDAHYNNAISNNSLEVSKFKKIIIDSTN